MKLSKEKMGGVALLTGALLTVFTAVLHPKGGSIPYLQSVAQRIAISHAIGLLAIPFLGLGFGLLTKKMGTDSFLSLVACAFSVTGLLAGLIAATINGLALPLYVLNYKDPNEEITTFLKLIIRYNIAVNQAFDYVFLGALSLAILFWSFSMLTLHKLPKWIGYFGLILSLSVMVMFFTGFVFVNLHGFRLFLFLLVVWVGMVGVALWRSQVDELIYK